MFDFNLLFKKVFASNDDTFKPNENYFTVFINCAGDVDYYADFDTQRHMHIGDAYYKEITLSEETDAKSFRSQIEALDREFAITVDKAFVFLMDFSSSEGNPTFAGEYIDIVRNLKNTSDTVSVIAVMPDEVEQTEPILSLLEENIRQNEILYLYNKRKYREKTLSDAVCGVVVLHSSKSLYASLRQNEQSYIQMLNSALAGLPEEGAAAIKAKKPIFWSTLGCSFSNPKIDHLRNYVAIMCDKAKKYSRDDHRRLCGELYSGMASISRPEMMNLLTNVIECIPKVTKNIPKYDGYTLKDYFSQLYGSNGTQIVELSFKVTLAMQPTSLNEKVVINAANTIFERISEYHSENLHEDITKFLSEYCQELKYQFDQTKASMNSFILQHAENDSFEEDLRKYIDNYIKYYELQRCSDFWMSVLSYINNHKHLFEDAVKRSKDMNDQLIAIKRELQLRNSVAMDPDAVRSYTAGEILDAYNRPEICREIADMYVAPEKESHAFHDVDMNHLCRLMSAPGFAKELKYKTTTGNGGYTAYLKQNIGKYLHFYKDGRA